MRRPLDEFKGLFRILMVIGLRFSGNGPYKYIPHLSEWGYAPTKLYNAKMNNI
jgi:hypothetical protein